MQLRDYQEAAVAAVYADLQHSTGNPCVVLPTGSGKTPVIAQLCSDAVLRWNGRVLVLAHVKELLEQTARTLAALCPTIPVGIYSAGLKRRDTKQAIIVGGIQSVHRRASLFGRFDLVIVDEAHLIKPDKEGMYRTFLDDLIEANPDMRVIGLTATPFRLGSGLICGPDNLLTNICYEAGIRPLIARGFLSPLVNKGAKQAVDTSALKIVRGEYEEAAAESLFMDVVAGAVKEIVEKTADRKAVLLFCQTIAHAEAVALELAGQSSSKVVTIYGTTAAEERRHAIAKFRAGEIRYLVNVNVLTTGFDAPNVDCVCLLRATVSPGLYYQMVGRGFRLHPGKDNCLILDFGQNIKRHGPVDKVRPAKKSSSTKGDEGKTCPECESVVSVGYAACPDCGYIFETKLPEIKHGTTAADESPVSDGTVEETHDKVTRVTYSVHVKKDSEPGHPRTLRVNYQIGTYQWKSEWVCVEHSGFAGEKARKWWNRRCNFPMPKNAAVAVQVARHGCLADTLAITQRQKSGEKYPEIIGHELGDVPLAPEPCPDCGSKNARAITAASEDEFTEQNTGNIVCSVCFHSYGFADHHAVSYYGYYPGVNPGLLPKEYERNDAPEDSGDCRSPPHDDCYDAPRTDDHFNDEVPF